VLPADKMRDHMIKVHMNLATQEFACPKPDCNTLYSSIASLRAHMTQQHQVPAVTGNGSLIAPKVYTCEVPGCNSVSSTCWTKCLLLCCTVSWYFVRKLFIQHAQV